MPPEQPRRARRGAALVLLLAVALAGGSTLLVMSLRGGGSTAAHLVPRGALSGDPLAFRPGQAAALEQAAADGLSQVLYAKSPGGVLVAAARTASYRPLIDQATSGTAIDPSIVEAIVFLESAGRPDVIAGNDPAAAAGLTQIVAETGSSFLGMRVDLAKSRLLTAEIATASAHGEQAKVLRLEAKRRIVDTRFDPAKALAGTVRYLSTARTRFGREDLAVVSYHMGIGNLENVLRAYVGTSSPDPIATLVHADGLSWARIYFSSSPAGHAGAWRRLLALSDDSQTYYWRVLAAAQIMRLYRDDPRQLEALAYLHERKASAEEVLHPEPVTPRFLTPGDVQHALGLGLLAVLPDDPQRLHFRIDPRLGELAPELDRSPQLYRALRPEALALLIYLAGRVHEISGTATPLDVTSAVRDEAYQGLVAQGNAEATTAYSLHTTGYAFDLLRRYGSPAEARALQYELEQLQARNLITWVREPADIHVTVSSQARVLVPSLLEPG